VKRCGYVSSVASLLHGFDCPGSAAAASLHNVALTVTVQVKAEEWGPSATTALCGALMCTVL
jgi:hypothetical protein